MPVVQIEVTVGLIQRDGTPHDGPAGTACDLDAVDAGCHIGKMTEVSGNSQRQSVSLSIHLPSPPLIRAGREIRGQISPKSYFKSQTFYHSSRVFNHRKHKRHKNEDIRKFCDFCAFCGSKKNIINRHSHHVKNLIPPA